jgi:hypothetical protein
VFLSGVTAVTSKVVVDGPVVTAIVAVLRPGSSPPRICVGSNRT